MKKLDELFEELRITAKYDHTVTNIGEISRYKYKKLAEMIEDFKEYLDLDFELDIITKEQWVKENSVYHLMKTSLETAKIK